MKISKSYLSVLLLLPVVGLVGCGGGSDSGDSAKGNRTIGVVTAVSGNESLTVSGNTFDTSGLSGVSGDDASSVSDMKPGMVASVTSDDDMEADDVEYDAEVEGILTENNVTGNSGTLVVMGQTITVNEDTMFESKVEGIDSIEAIPADTMAVVEVSGFADGSGGILATYVKLEDDEADEEDEMEVEGTISNLNTDSMTFDINGFSVQYDENTEIEVELANGIYVEVEMYLDGSGNLIAEEIEREDDDHGDEGDEIELEGIVTSDGVMNGMFDINGETVKLAPDAEIRGGATDTEVDIVKDAIVEVEGYLDADGMLVVHEVEFETELEDEEDEEDDVIVTP